MAVHHQVIGSIAMLYAMYQARVDMLEPLRVISDFVGNTLEMQGGAISDHLMVRQMIAACELFSKTKLTYQSPPFAIDQILDGNQLVDVTEERVFQTPFASLIKFRKETVSPKPKVLVVAPLSGHYATLLRATVQTLLLDHEVYITDWHNARDVALSAGRFGFDEYVEHLVRFLEFLGPEIHLLAVCQPCVQALIAASIMAEDQNPCQPSSLTLMAGPIDTRINPTKVNELATAKPIDWFKSNLIATVPFRYRGAGRRVYPGFVQLSAFMSMNLNKHVKAHADMYGHIVFREKEKLQAARDFYDEYFAVLDLAEEFYIETVDRVFQQHLLPKGKMTYFERAVRPDKIKKASLLTVEGERDDICALGQTMAAHDLCSSIRPYKKKHHMQAGVGHYGVFSGGKWTRQVYPIVRNFILMSE
jgi:poly(3-hydroxybutyrate) depolymerase